MARFTTRKRSLRERYFVLCPFPCLRPRPSNSHPQSDAVVEEGIALSVIPKLRLQQLAAYPTSGNTGVPLLPRAKTAAQRASPTKLQRLFRSSRSKEFGTKSNSQSDANLTNEERVAQQMKRDIEQTKAETRQISKTQKKWWKNLRSNHRRTEKKLKKQLKTWEAKGRRAEERKKKERARALKLKKAQNVLLAQPPRSSRARYKAAKTCLDKCGNIPSRKAIAGGTFMQRRRFTKKERARRKFARTKATTLGCMTGNTYWRSEMKILQYLNHPNIISYEEAYLFESGPNPIGGTNRILDYGLYDLGTLYQLSHRYKLASEQQRTQLYPPEPFAWHVFQSLLTAIVYMHTGYATLKEFLSSKSDTAKHWMPIYHMDVRPENILLKSSASPNEYPHVTLAGFSGALSQAALDAKDPLLTYNIDHTNNSPQLSDTALLIDTIKSLCISSPFYVRDANDDMQSVPFPTELPAHYHHNLRIALYTHWNEHDTPRARLLALAKVVDLQTSDAVEYEPLPEGIVTMKLEDRWVFEPLGWENRGLGLDVEERGASLEVDGGWFEGSDEGEWEEVCLEE
jgi:hypothetical protein